MPPPVPSPVPKWVTRVLTPPPPNWPTEQEARDQKALALLQRAALMGPRLPPPACYGRLSALWDARAEEVIEVRGLRTCLDVLARHSRQPPEPAAHALLDEMWTCREADLQACCEDCECWRQGGSAAYQRCFGRALRSARNRGLPRSDIEDALVDAQTDIVMTFRRASPIPNGPKELPFLNYVLTTVGRRLGRQTKGPLAIEEGMASAQCGEGLVMAADALDRLCIELRLLAIDVRHLLAAAVNAVVYTNRGKMKSPSPAISGAARARWVLHLLLQGRSALQVVDLLGAPLNLSYNAVKALERRARTLLVPILRANPESQPLANDSAPYARAAERVDYLPGEARDHLTILQGFLRLMPAEEKPPEQGPRP